MNKILIALTLFLFAFFLRLWNINQAGRTSDEFAYVDTGYRFVELIKKGDFTNPFWHKVLDHPPIAKYLYGIAAHFDTVESPEGKKDTIDGKKVYQYDWVWSRLVSVIFTSLTVLIVVLFAAKYFSSSTAIISGIILSMLPILLGLSQLVTIEGVKIFFYTSSIISFFYLLEKTTYKRVIMTGLLTGLAFGTKGSAILLIPTLFIIYALWYFLARKTSNNKIHIKKPFFYLLLLLWFCF